MKNFNAGIEYKKQIMRAIKNQEVYEYINDLMEGEMGDYFNSDKFANNKVVERSGGQ